MYSTRGNELDWSLPSNRTINDRISSSTRRIRARFPPSYSPFCPHQSIFYSVVLSIFPPFPFTFFVFGERESERWRAQFSFGRADEKTMVRANDGVSSYRFSCHLPLYIDVITTSGAGRKSKPANLHPRHPYPANNSADAFKKIYGVYFARPVLARFKSPRIADFSSPTKYFIPHPPLTSSRNRWNPSNRDFSRLIRDSSLFPVTGLRSKLRTRR